MENPITGKNSFNLPKKNDRTIYSGLSSPIHIISTCMVTDISLNIFPETLPPPQKPCVCFCSKVVDKISGKPIGGVNVTVTFKSHVQSSTTSAKGEFCLALPSSWTIVSVCLEKKGYDTRYIGTVFPCCFADLFTLCAKRSTCGACETV